MNAGGFTARAAVSAIKLNFLPETSSIILHNTSVAAQVTVQNAFHYQKNHIHSDEHNPAGW